MKDMKVSLSQSAMPAGYGSSASFPRTSDCLRGRLHWKMSRKKDVSLWKVIYRGFEVEAS